MTTTTINKDYAIIHHDAPPLERLRVWLTNLYHWRTTWAVRHLSKQLQNDPEFRQLWHANIAMPIYDEFAAELGRPDIGVSNIALAERCADRLMKHLFNA